LKDDSNFKMFNKKILAALSVFSFLFAMTAYADTIYLKNGKSLQGLISREDEDALEMDVGGGTVVFRAEEIQRIYRSTPKETEEIRNNWELNKIQREKTKAQDMEEKAKASAKWDAMVDEERRYGAERRYIDANTKIVQASRDRGHIRVDAVLNEDVHTSLIVDTGCPVVLLTASMAGKLGIDLKNAPNAPEVMVLNGKHKVKQIVLKTIKLGDLEEKNVAAQVMVEDDRETRQLKGGLLGMSFLGRFNVTFDQKKSRLIFRPRL